MVGLINIGMGLFWEKIKGNATTSSNHGIGSKLHTNLWFTEQLKSRVISKQYSKQGITNNIQIGE